MTQRSSRNRTTAGRDSRTFAPATGSGRLPVPGTPPPSVWWTMLVLIVVVVFVCLLVQRGQGLPEATNGALIVGLAAAELTRRLIPAHVAAGRR